LVYNEVMDPEQCERVAEVVSVLANPLRVRIVCLLRLGARTVSQLTETLGAKQPNVSQHLRILYDRGLVKRRRDQREVYYSLSGQAVVDALRALAELAGVRPPV
jgi:DNA-binding transcriptional ArsR family regulator